MDPADIPGPPDASFATLCAFFDARYDRAGNLVTPPYPGAQVPAAAEPPTSSVAAAAAAAAAGPGSGTTAAPGAQGAYPYIPRLRRRATDASHASNPPLSQAAPPTANAVHVAAANGQGAKLVRFPIRLDLHNVGLAPLPPAVRAARQRNALNSRSPAGGSNSVRKPSRGFSTGAVAVSDSIPEHAVSATTTPENAAAGNRPHLTPLSTTDLPSVDGSLTASPTDIAPAYQMLSFVLPCPDPSQEPGCGQGLAANTSEDGSWQPQDPASMRRESSFTTVASGASTGALAATGPPLSPSPAVPAGASNKEKDRRPSFFQRVLDKGFRNKARSSSFAPGAPAPSFRTSDHRRGSIPAPFHAPHSTHAEPSLGTPWERPNLSSDNSPGQGPDTGHFDTWSDVVADSEGPGGSVLSDTLGADEVPFAEGDDLITLLRNAANAAHTILAFADDAQPSPSHGRDKPPGEKIAEEESAPDLLAKLSDDRWLEGPLDPNPVVVAGALGLALGWEGIMDLCYGPGSRADCLGDFVALGRAAAIHRAVEEDQAKIIAWVQSLPAPRPPEQHAVPAPDILPDPLPQEDTEWDRLSLDELYRDIDRLDPETCRAPRKASTGSHMTGNGDEDGPRSWLKKIRGRVHTHEANGEDLPKWSPNGHPQPGLTEALLASHDEAQARAEAAAQGTGQPTRTWHEWMNLLRSLAGWVAEYELTRIRADLVDELLPNKPDPAMSPDAQATHVGGRAARSIQIPPVLIPPDQDINAYLPTGLVSDLACSSNAFRRRPGMPGPTIWGREQLSTKHISTPMTLLTQSMEHQTMQLSSSTWTARSGWELEYLDMCVFHSPVVAQRFPPPPAIAVRAGQAFCPSEAPPSTAPPPASGGPDAAAMRKTNYLMPPQFPQHYAHSRTGGAASHMADGGIDSVLEEGDSVAAPSADPLPAGGTTGADESNDPPHVGRRTEASVAASARANLCPMPIPEGAWLASSWRAWLAGVHEGQILVPAVAWQAWWTLIAILNGADRTGRSYDLQVKSFEEPFAALTDPRSVYI